MTWIILFIAGILTILTLLVNAIQISIWIVLGAMLVIAILGINFIKADYYDYDCGYDFSITPLLILISLELVLIATYMATKYNNIEIENKIMTQNKDLAGYKFREIYNFANNSSKEFNLSLAFTNNWR